MNRATLKPFAALALFLLLGNSSAMCGNVEFHATFDRERSALKLVWERGSSENELILINLGQLIGNILQFGPSISMYISGPEIQSGRLVPRSQPAGLAGKVVPFVVCLLPGAEYALSVDAHSLLLPSSHKSLADVRERPWTLTVSFTGKQAVVTDSSGRFRPEDGISQYGKRIDMWIGTSKSVVHN